MTATATAPTHTETPQWSQYLRRTAIAFVLSRLCVVAGAAIVAAQKVAAATKANLPRPKNAVGLITDVFTSWDGAWYFRIIRNGYPRVIPPQVTYEMPEARAAFFPVYPMLVRAADTVLPGGDVLAGIVVNTLLAVVGIWLVGLLARDLFGERVAYRAMLLMVVFPGSLVLTFTYSEATLIAVSAGCLLMLHRRHWLAAGVLAAIGTATRPNGVALIAACAVAAGFAIHQRREWRALAAVALSPIGFIWFQVFLRMHTGEWAWFRVQREAWKEGTSFGMTAIDNTLDAFRHPLSSPTDIITAVAFLTMLALVWVMWKRRLPWPVLAYVVVVLLLMILPSTVTARPRFLYTAFPALIAVAAWWPEDHDEAWTALIALSTAGLVALTGLYGVLGAIP